MVTDMKVFALKENVRKCIIHPLTRARFDAAGEADWPMDQFTRARIRDGDIALSANETANETPPAEGEEGA
jgi:hypothetical protein